MISEVLPELWMSKEYLEGYRLQAVIDTANYQMSHSALSAFRIPHSKIPLSFLEKSCILASLSTVIAARLSIRVPGELMIPFEFVIEGPPVSQQTRRRARLNAWKNAVIQAARRYWPPEDTPSSDHLTIIVTTFFETAAPDVDNIVKPIQDALIGIVYNDDGQITDALTRKRNITGSFKVKGLSRALADGFVMNKDFVHVKIVLSNNFEEIQ